MPAAPCTSGSITSAASSAWCRPSAGDRGVGPVGVVVARGAADGEAQRIEHVGAEPAGAHRDRADGVAVVGAAQGQVGTAGRGQGSRPAASSRLAQCWNAIFSACSTAAAPSDANRKWGPSTGTTGASASASSIVDPVAVAEHGRVADQVDLVAERLVELGHPVAERRDPQRRDGIEVAVAVDVDQLATLAALDDDRLVVGVGRHLGEAVPHHRGVAVDPSVPCALGRHARRLPVRLHRSRTGGTGGGPAAIRRRRRRPSPSVGCRTGR